MSDIEPTAPSSGPLLPGTPEPPANARAADPAQVAAELEASKLSEALGRTLEDQWRPAGDLFEGR
jgi:hypothetical protein